MSAICVRFKSEYLKVKNRGGFFPLLDFAREGNSRKFDRRNTDIWGMFRRLFPVIIFRITCASVSTRLLRVVHRLGI